MTHDDLLLLQDLDRDDRKWTVRERAVTAMILVIGLTLALFIGYEINLARGDVRSIRCEEGNVTLILERAGGATQRVECPAVVPVKP